METFYTLCTVLPSVPGNNFLYWGQATKSVEVRPLAPRPVHTPPHVVRPPQ